MLKNLLFLGSSCIYPKFAKIPITEDQLLTGPLEASNDAYAIAKIAGIKMCQAYRKQYGFNAVCSDANKSIRYRMITLTITMDTYLPSLDCEVSRIKREE